MDWTKPLSFLMAVLVGILAIASAIELGRTTLAGDYVVASVVTMALVVVAVVAAIVVGAKDKQWLENPDSYF